MSKQKNAVVVSSGQFDTNDVSSSTALVEEASVPFAGVVRMDVHEDKQHLAKFKRGSGDVVKTVARLGKQYGIVPPGVSLDEVVAKVESARDLEPLLAVVGKLYDTLRDSQLASEGEAWSHATATYGMLQNAAKVNKTLRGELAPVRSWFKSVVVRKSPATKAASPPVVTPDPVVPTK